MRSCCALALTVLLLAGCALNKPMPSPTENSQLLMYVGTYTRETSAGIYAYRFDSGSGQAKPLGLVAAIRDPSFLAIHPSGEYLYAVTESDDFDSDGSGSVSSFAINHDSGRLRKMNEVSSKGGWPCHLNVDGSGRMLIVANYKGGSVASFPVHPDGTLGTASSYFQHEGSSVHSRQEQPHAHSADFSADNRFAFFSDLGLDQVKVYRADPSTASLTPHEPPHVTVEPGSGPRQIVQHPSGRFAYGLNELSSTATAYSYVPETGTMQVLQTISTLPDGFDGESYAAEIHVHPSGRFVYASNRGHDSIAIFEVEASSGLLRAIARAPTNGSWPRNFAIDSTGTYLLAANQHSDNITVFRIDPETGSLDVTGNDISVNAPVCIVFLNESG